MGRVGVRSAGLLLFGRTPIGAPEDLPLLRFGAGLEVPDATSCANRAVRSKDGIAFEGDEPDAEVRRTLGSVHALYYSVLLDPKPIRTTRLFFPLPSR